MKKIKQLAVLTLATLFSITAFSQSTPEPEALGLPGDNLSLYAVLEVFQKSKTLEDFEKAINDKESNINNLDLNNDEKTDYIRVLTEQDGENHTIILQVAVTEKQNQDVAVIDVSKNKEGKIIVQIIGDEELYGKDYVIEPSKERVTGTPNPGYTGEGTVIINNNTTNNYNTTNNTTTNNASNGATFNEPSAWSVVLFMYSPLFMPYRSPYYWGFYPPYWSPWRPMYYHQYWGFHGHFHYGYYRRSPAIYRSNHYRNNYYNRRSTSAVVAQNRRDGRYKGVYNGRDYNRPVAPTRPSSNRPSTRPSTRPTDRPSARPTRPTDNQSTRPSRPTTKPTTRPSGNGSANENSRPATSRPKKPMVMPSKPASRPATNTASRPARVPSPKVGNRN